MKRPIIAVAMSPMPTVAHEHPCANCPSANGFVPDPEVADILELPLAARAETVFRCAWRPEKLCRGYCDTIGVTAAIVPRSRFA